MPAVIGVVFVFLVGVVIWVIASSGDGADPDAAPDDAEVTATSDASVTTTSAPSTTTPPTLSPTPLPSTTEPSTASSTTSTTGPTTSTTEPTAEPTVPPTTSPGAGDGAVPGDLAVPGVPMQRPPCDGSYITILASPIGDQATGAGVGAVLDQYPGSHYLRTDQSCSSLSQDADGEPIYVIFFGPFAFDSDACAARADGPEGAYARQLSNDLGPDHAVACA